MIKPGMPYRKTWMYIFIILGLCSCATPSNVAVLQKGAEERPEDFRAHIELAKAYLEKGIKWEAAPEVGTPVLASRKWVKKAQRELEKATELDPLSPEPHYWLKVIYTAMGKYKAADGEIAIFNNLTAKQHKQVSQ